MATRTKPRNSVLFYLNGERREITGAQSVGSLLSYLRTFERLTGTKLGCGEGGCGACTVMLSNFDKHSNRIHHHAANACLMPLAACDGAAITTVEAIGDRKGGLHPVQLALINWHGTQCGFCTPGIVMNMYALIREHLADPERAGLQLTELEIETNFDGNLCRCTGYRPILDAFKNLVVKGNSLQACCDQGENCCRANGASTTHEAKSASPRGSASLENEKLENHDNIKRDLVFPHELIGYRPPELEVDDGAWLRPVSLRRLMELRCEYPEAHIVVGNTELGIDMKFKNLRVSTFLCATHIPELSQITESETGVRIGASVTWHKLSVYIRNALNGRQHGNDGENASYKLRSLQAIQSQLQWFAGKQVRNVACVGGNIVTASPISDINPIWIAIEASFVLLNCKTTRKRTVDARDFFLSYRKVDMTSDEILLCVDLPWNKSQFDFVYAFKVSRRKEDDIAIVSAGIRFRLQKKHTVLAGFRAESESCSRYLIDSVSIGLGGVAPKTIAAEEVESTLVKKDFSEEAFTNALQVMARCTTLPKNVPGGMPEYRQTLAMGFLLKAFIKTSEALERIQSNLCHTAAPFTRSISCRLGDEEIGEIAATHTSRGVQILPKTMPLQNCDHTGRPIQHLSAQLQVSGEAKYLDDVGPFPKELQAALVLSTEAHAEIVSIDFSVAEKMCGVYRIVRHGDVKGTNMIGVANDELCFARNIITTMGQVIAIVTAETYEQAREASRAVKIIYNVLEPVITIEEAIEAESFARGEPEHTIQKGKAQEILLKAERDGQSVNGCVRIGAQEHWYLEPHGTIAIPDENGEMTVLASTQTPSMTQATVANVLGESMNKVVCKVKRIGGGFGGKETRSFFVSAATAVAAQATSRPVRLILDRDADMLTTGTRHAFLAKYIAAYEPTGRITALDLKVFLNMGNSIDLSIPVLDRCLFHAQNCYDIPHLKFVGKACMTNSASATAFRGFGGPQGMIIMENVIEHVASAAKQSQIIVRELNMYGKNNNSSVTPFGMSVDVSPLLRCWDEALRDSSYAERRQTVNDYNDTHKFRKRGIAAIPTMFGISFNFVTLNQAAALVHIFHQDGTVLLSHGGVEMGQGLHTKMCQVAATELGVALSKVFISETSTDKIPNASPTAASASSDMYGMAVKKACQELLKNLVPFRKEREDQTWEDLVHQAWFNRVSLSATGFYRTPNLDAVNLAVPGSMGRPFQYYTNGAAVSEVEVDTLTGEFKVLRTDIVMDVGRPLNPAIDVGQIEGAFVQGLGWCTMEEVVRGSRTDHTWLKAGKMHTVGPSTYKIPGFRDIPIDFRVRVLESRNDENTIHSSKGVGEPPLFLAASVFFALRDAIHASRSQGGRHGWFELNSPASVERVRMLCVNTPLSNLMSKEPSTPSLSL